MTGVGEWVWYVIKSWNAFVQSCLQWCLHSVIQRGGGRGEWYRVIWYGNVVVVQRHSGCNGGTVWYDTMVVWYDAVVVWYDTVVVWYDTVVVWYNIVVVCMSQW